MDPHMWKKPWSRLFKGKATKVDNSNTLVETPKFYLNLTTRCMEQVDRVSSIGGSSILKFNQEQCKYLATKLQLAIQSASSIIDEINAKFLSLGELEEMAQLLEIFKLLYAMGVEVEDFIQSCCKELWIQSAIMQTSMSRFIASIGFNLEFCTIVFSTWCVENSIFLIHFDVARVHQVQVEIVKEKANLDEAKLTMDMKRVVESNPSSSPNWLLATFLLGRLEMVKVHPSSLKIGSKDQLHFPPMSSLKQMQDCLGRGAFGSVHKAMWLGVEVAKKTFYGPSSADFLREVEILGGLNHPNIVSLLWYMSDEKRCHLVMELMDENLFSWMQQRMEENGNQGCPFTILEVLDLILQIGEGMLYLHERRIVHRDLKSYNILIRCGKVAKGNVKNLQVKVADFGLLKTKERSATYSDLTMNVGTTRWMAPEVMKIGNVQSTNVDEERGAELNYPFKIDIYSFAMVCYEVLTGEVPFSSLSHSEVKKAVLNGDRPPLPKECPNRLRTLIESCWSIEANMRPSFGDICEELRDLKYAKLQTYWETMLYQCPLEDIVTMDKLVAKLSSPIVDIQRSAINDIHLLSKKSVDHRIYIKEQGVLPLIVLLYYSKDYKTQVQATTALQTLFVDDLSFDPDPFFQIHSLKDSLQRIPNFVDSISKEIYLINAIGPIVEVLKSGCMEARGNAAKALINVSSDLGGKVIEKIRSFGVILALVALLECGSAEGQKYAIKLLWMCLSQQDYASAIQAGIIPLLMNVIAHRYYSMLDYVNIVDEAFNILAKLVKDLEGLIAITKCQPTPILVKFIASGRNSAIAIAILHRLCMHDSRFIMESKYYNVVHRLTSLTKDIGHYPSLEVSTFLQLLQEPKVNL